MRRRRFGMGALVLAGLTVPALATAARAGEPAAPKDVQALTATIDRLTAEKWTEAKVQPAPPATDAEFLRRVYLDLVGKIPTVAEARAFLDDPAPDKRARLVERLLQSPGHVNHFTTVWRTVLMPEGDGDFQAQFAALDFEVWLHGQIKDNVGFDALARAVISTPLEGNGQRRFNLFDRQNKPSPAGYYLAKGAKPENLAAGAARTFLGLRIECAQCHDHPFARWKREEFWGLAAFFGGVEKQGPEDQFGPLREVPDRRELAIPGTEKVVQAGFLDGREPEWQYKVGPRVTLAAWMTAAENPYFARATVNRVWAHFFGVGIVDPVDDMDDKPASHPELLDELARRFARHGFDVKYLIRALTASRAYQLSSASDDPSASGAAVDPQLFARMSVKGLSAAQLYDSLARTTGLETPARNRNPFADQNTPRGEFLQRFARRDEKPTETQTSILQALALMNGRLVSEATSADKGALLGAVLDAPFLDTAGRIETIYLAALSRKPRPDEAARLADYVTRGGPSGDPKKALADVFWALLNSGEFLLNH